MLTCGRIRFLLELSGIKGAIDSSNTSLLDEMLVNLLLMLSGIFFSSAGGWLLCWWTYDSLLLGFINGLLHPFVRLKVT